MAADPRSTTNSDGRMQKDERKEELDRQLLRAFLGAAASLFARIGRRHSQRLHDRHAVASRLTERHGEMPDVGHVTSLDDRFHAACRLTPSCTSRSTWITNVSNETFNGQWVQMRIPIPYDHSCNYADPLGCWLRVNFAFPAAVQDTTTWTAQLTGDPVRLIQETASRRPPTRAD